MVYPEPLPVICGNPCKKGLIQKIKNVNNQGMLAPVRYKNRNACHLLVWCTVVLILGGNLFGGFLPPRFRFNHINRDGTLYYSDVWVEIDAGGGWKLPFAVNFDNTRTEVSPYLGKGWRLSLFESHVIKRDDKAFFVIMPSGYKYKFVRRAPEFYEGNGGWTCIGTPDDCVLKPACGDESLTYKDGKLKSLFFGKRAFECVRDDRGLVTSLVDGKTGETVVECKPGPSGGLARLKFSGGEEIVIEQALPRVPTSGLQDKEPLVPSLSRITLKKRKTTKEYRSYIEDGGKAAGLRIESNHGLERDFQWDAQSHKVLSDGKWRYQIEQVGSDIDQRRTDQEGVEQRWFENTKEGYEILKGFSHSPEMATRTHYYPKGSPAALYHQTHKIEEERNGRWEVINTYSHDDKGRVIGEVDHKEGTDVRTEFDEKGGSTRRFHDLSGRLVKTIRFNEKGRPMEMIPADSHAVVRYNYGPDGAIVGRTVTDKSPPHVQAQELQTAVSFLERGLRYTAVGESEYPAETLSLHSEPGSDPREFSVRFVANYDSLGAKSLFNFEEWNGFNVSMQKYTGGTDGKTCYCFSPNEKSLALTMEPEMGRKEIYPFASRLEFVTLPFAMFLKQGKDYLEPAWRTEQDIEKGLGEIQAEAKKHPEETGFSISRNFEGTIWKAAFASGNLYPKELVIESDGVPLFKWKVTKWGDKLGSMTLPREIDTGAYMKGVLIRKTKVTLQSIGVSEVPAFDVPIKEAAEIRDLDADAFFGTGKPR